MCFCLNVHGVALKPKKTSQKRAFLAHFAGITGDTGEQKLCNKYQAEPDFRWGQALKSFP